MGLFDFLKKKSTIAVNTKIYTPSAEELSKSKKEHARQEIRNFQKMRPGFIRTKFFYSLITKNITLGNLLLVSGSMNSAWMMCPR